MAIICCMPEGTPVSCAGWNSSVGVCCPCAMCGRSGSAPPIAVSGAGLLSALLAAGAAADGSARLRSVGRSGSPAGGLLEAGELLEVVDESGEGELPLESLPLKCGLPSESVTTWGIFLPCFGLAVFLIGAAIGFHAP